MPEEVELNEEKGFIIVKSFGESKKEDAEGSLREVMKIYKERGINKVLVDLRELKEVAGTLDSFLLGENIAETTRDLQIRFAILMGDTKLPSINFVETVVLNRGGKIRIFNDHEEAVTWLLS